ncbi:GDSL-type esterase/lipase family protein [Agriterribacter sp.]|uniref:GDSL-type esterase/lipase family protein n=1 Tax=Agriterribacter sp. TaxID=2821509 RepID=UPI002CDD40E1|nr:GDSL-type esterase/lipase family protein [Agriterribacter sp.]HTN06170.1 GDSL-type esterase/lipase family protein [Agriterribacter sp.]
MIGILFVHHCSLLAQVQNEFNGQVRHLKTESGLEFGLWGGNGGSSQVPILFILANTIDETLGSEYFRQCGTRLAKQYGWLCVSLDLPYHGRFQSEGFPKELKGWANAVQRREDFVSDNNLRMREILEFLIQRGYADPKRVAVCGTSRGGYLALQFAAFEERVKSVAVFAPVTDLFVLHEFSDFKKDVSPDSYSLANRIVELSKKNVWIAIGNQDQRVGTDQAVRLAREISKLSTEHIKGRGEIELNVMFEPGGHTTPRGAINRAVEWIHSRYTTLLTAPKWDSTSRPDIFKSRVELFRSLPHSKKDIVFLGNSITFWGEWNQLTGLSRIKNRGIPGDITFGVLERLDEVIDGKPQKVFILIGINDLAANIPDSIILLNYKRIIHRIQTGSPSTKIYFQTILPTNDILNKGYSIYTKDENIRKINDALKQISFDSNRIEVIDLYELFADESGKLKKEYTWDGVHLNKNGYDQWVRLLRDGKYLKRRK